jgi:hypothetical protein
MISLNGNSRASLLLGWLFEAIVHKKLFNGGTFGLQHLDNETVHNLELVKTDGSLDPFKRNFGFDSVI